LADETENADRLSATFRFRAYADALDERGLGDLRRLARYLKENVERDAELLIFGFADTSGNYNDNLVLSEQRAQSIADRLTSLGVEVSAVAGLVRRHL